MANSIESNAVQRITVDVPRERLDVFNQMFSEFFGSENQCEVLEQRSGHCHTLGVISLRRLFAFAESSDCGGSRIIASVLASLFNGHRFQLDLTDLRLLSSQYFQDVINVLHLDHAPDQEVHRYFEDGGPRFERMFERYGLPDRSRPAMHLASLEAFHEESLREGLRARPVAAAKLMDALGVTRHG